MGRRKEEKEGGKKKRGKEGEVKEGEEGGWQQRQDSDNFYFLSQREKVTEDASYRFQQLLRQVLQ